MPAPDVMHFFLGPRSVDAAVYPDIEEYYADLVAIYRAEIEDLVRSVARTSSSTTPRSRATATSACGPRSGHAARIRTP